MFVIDEQCFLVIYFRSDKCLSICGLRLQNDAGPKIFPDGEFCLVNFLVISFLSLILSRNEVNELDFCKFAAGESSMQYSPADVSQLTSFTTVRNRGEPASNIFLEGHSEKRSATVRVPIFFSLHIFARICTMVIL